MNVTLRQANIDDREILANLLEKYNYEFSQYEDTDVNKLGLYGYKYLDCYWLEDNRWAYFIEVDGNLAGFIMVGNHPEAPDREADFCIAESFVMYKYRRGGVGKKAFFMIADLHKGRWQLKIHPKNLPSVSFWNKVVNEYTNGDYEYIKAYPDTEFNDGTLGDIIFFDNSLCD